MGAETDIELKPVFSTQGIKSSARNLRKEIEGIFDTNAGKKLDAQMQNLMNRMSTLAGKSRQVAKAMEELAHTKVPTKEYTALEKEATRLEKQLEKAEIKAVNLKETVGSSDMRYRKAADDAADLARDLELVNQRMEQLRLSGKDTVLGSATDDMRKLEEQQKNLYNSMVVTVNKAYELDPALRGSEGAASALSNAMRAVAISVGQVVKSLAGIVGHAILKGLTKLRDKFVQLTHAIRGSGNALGRLNFKTILKYAFGVRSMYFLFRKLRKAVMDGVNNLAQFNNGNNATNEALSKLKSSLTQLKNAWGAAFGPIIQAVTPMLLQLINYLTMAANAIANFVAIISGQSTFMKATAVQEDYAKSLDKTGKSAKNAYKQLAPFDDLQVLEKNSGGGGGGTAIDDMFKEVPTTALPSASQLGKDFAKWLKDGLEAIPWNTIRKKARELGKKLAQFLNSIWEDEQLAKDIGYTIGQALNTAVDFAEAFIDENNWRQMGHWLGTFVQTGLETFEWDHAGTTFGKLINGFSDTIKGFFERYKGGTLGSGIATFINNAINTIKADDLGEAVALVIGAPFKEISTFLKETDFKTMATKIGQFIIRALTGTDDNGQTIGQKIGETLGELINAASRFIQGLDASEIISALYNFFKDILVTAFETISWSDLWDALCSVEGAIIMGFGLLKFTGLGSTIVSAIASEIGVASTATALSGAATTFSTALGTAIAGALPGALVATGAFAALPHAVMKVDEELNGSSPELENAKKKYDGFFKSLDFGADMTTVLAQKLSDLSYVITNQYPDTAARDAIRDANAIVEGVSTAADVIARYVDLTSSGMQLNKDQLSALQEKWHLLPEDIDSVIQSMSDFAESHENKLNLASLGLQDYKGSWEELTKAEAEATQKTTDMKNTLINNIKGVNDSIQTAIDKMDTAAIAADHDTNDIKQDFVAINMEKHKQDMESFGDATVTAFGQTSKASAETKATLDEWFKSTIQTYFSKEQWTTLGDNITNAMSSAMTTFQENWTASMEVWREQLELDFGLEAWTLRFENITTAYTEWWTTFSETWATNIKTWETTHIEPYFSTKTWKKYGQQMNDGIMGGFKTIVGKIAGLLNNIIDLFNAAFAKLEDAMNDLINDFNKSASQLGVPTLSRVSYRPMSKVQIPALARGAVIPPNREFLAMLGDQRHGTNIEAPLDTIKQAFADVVANMQVSNTGYSEMTLDGETFARLLTPYVISELNRSGYNVKVLEA